MKRVFIAGCGGMLGEAVHSRFSDCAVLATDIDVNEPWLEHGDVRDYAGISRLIREFAPDLVINLAALTDLEACELDQDNAWLTNALGAENVGIAAKEVGATYVYISTAGVFDGSKDVFTDFDRPNPLSHYAKSKHYGEEWTLRAVEKHFVFRAGWMMGGGVRKDKKFINKIYKQIIEGKTDLRVVDDKRGTPTYTVDFADGIRHVVENGPYGLYNQVCTGEANRYDVAVAFVSELGLEHEITIDPVSSNHFQSEYFATRPASEQLINLKLNRHGLNVMRYWRDCLREYAASFVVPEQYDVSFINPLFPDIKLIIPAETAKDFASWNGGHQEAELIQWAKSQFSDSDGAFVDIGAHCGLWTTHMSSGFRRTYAFEPHPTNFKRLKKSVALSLVPHGRIELFDVALGATNASGIMRSQKKGNRGDSSFAQYTDGPDIEETDVTVRTLSFMLREANVALIKIDVEGSEYDVLLGAEDFLRAADLPPILFEHWDDPARGQRAKEDVFALLYGYGYEVQKINWPEEYLATKRK